MARQVERSGATVDEAVEAALAELGVGREGAKIEVLDEATDDGEARVLVRAVEAAPSLDEVETQADAVADFVDELLAKMDIDAIAEPNLRGDQMYVDIVDGPEDDMSLLIGRQGQTLDAIQELARMAIGRRLDQRVRVIVDVEDYRKRRDARLAERAREVAQRIAQDGGEEELESMNAYERKLVHDAAGDVEGVETSSRGEDPDRYVVIRAV
jgi:spoIIIJ-associated protein